MDKATADDIDWVLASIGSDPAALYVAWRGWDL